jgi:hypothetical protein
VIALTIKVKNAQKQNIEILVKNTLPQEIDIKQDIVIVPIYKDVPLYEGDYEVTPKVSEQTLPTAKKLMSEDVTIKEIPYFEVGNNSGGNTVYIAKEI